MNYLSVENLSKAYGVDPLFQNLSFGIQKGERVGLIARNGSGKSTLFKILTGSESADSGSFSFRKGVTIGHLGQKMSLPGELEVLDVLFRADNPTANAVKNYEKSLLNPHDAEQLQAAMDEMDNLNAWDYESQAKKLLSQFGIDDLTNKVKNLSGGQQKRLSLVKLLLEEPEFLLLDEPTNHLDVKMIEWLEEYLASKNFTIFLITHDRYFLDTVCNMVLEIDKGSCFQYKGGYNYYLEKKAHQEEVMESEISKAKNLMRKELEWVRRQPKARGTKSKSRLEAFDDIAAKASSGTTTKNMELEINMTRMGSKILELHHVSKAYGDNQLISNFDYVFKKGEKIGIVGDNGSGKSTLLEIIMHRVKPDKGKVVSGETIEFGYYRQAGMKLKQDQRVIEAVKDIAEVIPLTKGRKITASQLLERFLFSKDMHYNLISKLSGGEQRRLYLLTILMHNPNFLILDEPTNDFDIPTLTVLEDFLSDFPGCILVVTHDRYFLDKVVDHLLVFEKGGLISGYNGSYSDYRLSQKAVQKQPKTESPKKVKESSPKASNKITYKEKLEYEGLEVEIDQLEEEKKELVNKLSEVSDNHLELLRVGERLKTIESELENKGNRWLELSEKF